MFCSDVVHTVLLYTPLTNGAGQVRNPASDRSTNSKTGTEVGTRIALFGFGGLLYCFTFYNQDLPEITLPDVPLNLSVKVTSEKF